MTIDIRAVCTCSAGELISASISDSYRADSGLIFQRGSCTVQGINPLTIGTPVSFSYQGKDRGGSINRRLLVLGSSVDGLRGFTNFELGCDLTLLSGVQENKVYTYLGVGDPDLDADDAKVVTIPLRAQLIAEAILVELGIGGSCPLTNEFSVGSFDLSAGYVQVLSDLLKSESLVGYMSAGGSLVVQPALGGGTGGAFSADNVIDMQPLSIGPPPGSKVLVNYSRRKLKSPEQQEEENGEPIDPEVLNWEKEELIGLKTTVQVENPFWAEGPSGIPTADRPRYFEYTYTPYTLIERTYDSLDRLVKQVTTQETIMAEVAPGYVQHICDRYFVDPPAILGVVGPKEQQTPPIGANKYTIISTEVTKYKLEAPATWDEPEKPEGYEEVDFVESYVEEPVIKLVGSTQIYTYAGDLNIEFDYGNDNTTDRFIAEKQMRRAEQSIGAQKQQITKQTTERYVCQAYTQVGQQALAEAISKNAVNASFFSSEAANMFTGAQSLKLMGVETTIASGREIGLQQRPPQAERTAAAAADGGDPNDGWSTAASAESIKATGFGVGTETYSLPYAHDDVFFKISEGNYGVISNAAAAAGKALQYGSVQSSIRAGMRHGVNVKAAAYAYRGTPGGTAGVSVGGAAVYGLAEGVTYTMDSSGVIVSVDIVPLGTAGSV